MRVLSYRGDRMVMNFVSCKTPGLVESDDHQLQCNDNGTYQSLAVNDPVVRERFKHVVNTCIMLLHSIVGCSSLTEETI
jgi:hypothetical protein